MRRSFALASLIALAGCGGGVSSQPQSTPTPSATAAQPLISGMFRSCAQVPRSMHCSSLAVKLASGRGSAAFAKASPVLVGLPAPRNGVVYVITALSAQNVAIEAENARGAPMGVVGTVSLPVVSR